VVSLKKKIEQLLTTKTWKIDIESIKPFIMIKMATMEEMSQMSEKEQKITIKAVLMTVEKMRYHFLEDLTFKVVFDPKNTGNGNYIINKEANEITLKLDGDIDKTYKIGTVEENKIQLLSKGDYYNLILIPEN
jgi:hypothetical protein